MQAYLHKMHPINYCGWGAFYKCLLNVYSFYSSKQLSGENLKSVGLQVWVCGMCVSVYLYQNQF